MTVSILLCSVICKNTYIDDHVGSEQELLSLMEKRNNNNLDYGVFTSIKIEKKNRELVTFLKGVVPGMCKPLLTKRTSLIEFSGSYSRQI